MAKLRIVTIKRYLAHDHRLTWSSAHFIGKAGKNSETFMYIIMTRQINDF